MKKIFTLMLCAIAIATASSCDSSLSEQEKAIKAKVKELKKEGWKVVGDEDLTAVVSKHEEKKAIETEIEGKNYPAYQEEYGSGHHCNSIASGKEAARKDAPKIFAEISANGLNDDCDPSLLSDPRWNTFVENFESIYAEKLAAELIPSFYLYRELDTEDYDVTGYFLINNLQAIKLRQNAIKEAADIAGIMVKYKLDDLSEQETNYKLLEIIINETA